jgi:hypothetical protein
MKEIIVRVPDQKIDFVLQLIEHLGLEISTELLEISEEHKNIVRNRIQMSHKNPERLLNWEEIKDSFDLD